MDRERLTRTSGGEGQCCAVSSHEEAVPRAARDELNLPIGLANVGLEAKRQLMNSLTQLAFGKGHCG